MFHLCCRIALGVNIGNLFEFEGTFQRDREHQLSTKEEAVLVFGILLGDGCDFIVLLKHLFHLLGHSPESFHYLNAILITQVAKATEVEREHSRDHNLRCKCLGRSHPNLRTGVLVNTAITLAGDGRADAVVDR